MATSWIAVVVSLALPAAPPAGDQPAAHPPAAQAQAAGQPAQPDQPAPNLRTGRELMAACRAALQRWARPSDAQAQQAARELLGLYRELQQDTELAVTQREGLRVVLRRRLLALARQIERQVAARRKEAAQAGGQAQGQAPPTVRVPQQGGVLAQRGAWHGMMPGAMGPGAMRPGMMRPGVMAPGMMGPMGGAANQPPDAGEQLVDLIRQTVAPETWVENGGSGSMYYWWPGRALIVRQTDEVHEQIADLLRQLQRAGH